MVVKCVVILVLCVCHSVNRGEGSLKRHCMKESANAHTQRQQSTAGEWADCEAKETAKARQL